jgi:hypothetical protein
LQKQLEDINTQSKEREDFIRRELIAASKESTAKDNLYSSLLQDHAKLNDRFKEQQEELNELRNNVYPTLPICQNR